VDAGRGRSSAWSAAFAAALVTLGAVLLCLVVWAGPAEAAPTHPYNLGCKALAADDLAKATKLFQQAVKLEPDDTDALNNLAVCYLDSGEFAKADALLKKVLSLNAKYRGADLNIGAGYLLNGDPASAEAPTRTATDAPPTANGKDVKASAYYNLGLIEADAGQYAKARADLEKSASLQARAETDVALGSVQCAQGDYDAGIATLQSAVAQHPEQYLADAVTADLAAAYYQRGMSRLQQRDVAGAEADFKASAGKKKSDYAVMGLALVSAERGDTAAAGKTLTSLKTSKDPGVAKAAAVNLLKVQDLGKSGGSSGSGTSGGWLSWLVLLGGGVLFAVQTYAVLRAAAARPRGPLAAPLAAFGAVAGVATAVVFALSFFGSLDNDTYVLAALGVDVVIVVLTLASPSLGRHPARTA
jgi:tetratricopeptide (TPR) repeat protein